MTRRRLAKRPVVEHHYDAEHDAGMTAAGRPLRRINGVWCGLTRANTWRPARWLHKWPTELLDYIHERQLAEPGRGQLELLHDER